MPTFNFCIKAIGDDRASVPYELRRRRAQAGEVVESLPADIHPGTAIVDGPIWRVMRVTGVPSGEEIVLSSRDAETLDDLTFDTRPRRYRQRVLLKDNVDVKNALTNRVPFADRRTFHDFETDWTTFSKLIFAKTPELRDVDNQYIEPLDEVGGILDQDL